MKSRFHKILYIVFWVLLCAYQGMVQAGEIQQQLQLIQTFFPNADNVSELQGTPPSAEVYQGLRVIGYVYYTDDVIKIPAYSGKPIRTLVGFDMSGKIVGLKIVHHEEPILVVGISDADLKQYTDQYIGKYVSDKIKVGGRDRDGYQTVDAISGATITVMVLNATITRSMREVAISRGLIKIQETSQPQADIQAIDDPIWLTVWQSRVFQIVVLCIGLFVLLLILFMQDWLARHPTLLQRIRTGYLIYTVLFIGWYTLAQLSIVNVFTFISSFMHDFSWENFIMEPMIFMLWGFVAITILLWGRGVYCGWLCPFGALQELLFRIGEKAGIRSFEFPEVIHERLWAIKYMLLLLLFGTSMQSLTLMEQLAEVEPFKTVFTLHFQRQWGFLTYALALLAVSLFNRKFYCRYICPLGAALTFPSKFRIFEWLRRYKECGRPCQVCRTECEVRAIRGTGEIIDTECHYCLDCQVTYWNDKKCPPLVEKRKRRERLDRRVEFPDKNSEISR